MSDADSALVVGYLKDGALWEGGASYDKPSVPSVTSAGTQGPIVGFRVGRTFHGLLPGAMHTPEPPSS